AFRRIPECHDLSARVFGKQLNAVRREGNEQEHQHKTQTKHRDTSWGMNSTECEQPVKSIPDTSPSCSSCSFCPFGLCSLIDNPICSLLQWHIRCRYIRSSFHIKPMEV